MLIKYIVVMKCKVALYMITAIHYRLLGGLKMNIEERIYHLCEKLMGLGYYRFQVKSIMQSVMGNNDVDNASGDQQLKIVNVLENYEKLANDYFFAYSK